MQFKTSKRELVDLLKAWLALSIAFTILIRPTSIGIVFIYSLITVGSGFIVHELAHKFVAQKYHCWAEFRADNKMLLVAILMSFVGFLFAAPGAVMIRGHTHKKQSGIISLAGPVSNIVVSLLFFILTTNPVYAALGFMGFKINAWLAAFNLIPIGIFDGAKVWSWNKAVYLITALFAVILVFLSF